MLRKRLLAAFVMIGFVAGLIVLDWQMYVRGKWYLPGVLILVLTGTVLGCREFYRLASSETVVPARWLGTAMAVLTVAVIWLLSVGAKYEQAIFGEAMRSETIRQLSETVRGPAPVALCLGVAIALFFATRMVRRRPTGTLVSVAVTLGGVVYVGVLVSFIILIGAEPLGPLRVATFLSVVKGSDVGAYFVGRFLGRHPMIPWVSPKKTWEGFAGALAMGMLLAFGLGEIWARVPGGAALAWWQRLTFGLVVAAVGHFGDLCESLMKRDAHMKDSGRDVPGFGGVLDVIDSPLIAGPFAFLLLVAFRGGG
jgi:phosphatidate cytidylyltransferase